MFLEVRIPSSLVKPWESPCLKSKVVRINPKFSGVSKFPVHVLFPLLDYISLSVFATHSLLFIFLSQCLWTMLVPLAHLRIPVPGRPIPHPMNLALLVSCLKQSANIFWTSFTVLVCLLNFFKFFMVAYLDPCKTSMFIIWVYHRCCSFCGVLLLSL